MGPWFLVQFSFRPSSHFGGDEGDRTPDPLLAGQVLSQLSYTPMGLVFLFLEQSLKIEQQQFRTRLLSSGRFHFDTRSYLTLSCLASRSP